MAPLELLFALEFEYGVSQSLEQKRTPTRADRRSHRVILA
jgi:hypothetical protein